MFIEHYKDSRLALSSETKKTHLETKSGDSITTDDNAGAI